MARTYAKLKGSIWRDDDWRALPSDEQRLYLLLLSQPEISNCGVIPYLPSKWARMASDTSFDEVVELAERLQEHRFIVVDEDACEVLVRTFVKHDQVVDQPKIRAAAVRQFDMIQSRRIRTVLADEHPDVFTLGPHEHPHPEPYGNPTRYPSESLREGYAEPFPRARARAASRQPPPPTAPAPATRQQQPADPANPSAAENLERLRAAGWSKRQLAAAHDDPDRALAWLEHATSDPKTLRPGALAWRGFSDGNWPPEQRPEIAPGATGTRSVTPDLPYVCEHCTTRFKTEAKLADHVARIHADTAPAPPPDGALERLRAAANDTPADDPEPVIDPEPTIGRG